MSAALKRKAAAHNGRIDAVQAALASHAETVAVDFGGEERRFLLCARGATLARERGHDPVAALFRIVGALASSLMPRTSDARLDIEALKAGGINAAAMVNLLGAINGERLADLTLVLWWGFLPFEGDLPLEVVEVYASPGELRRVASTLLPRLAAFVSDYEDEGADEPLPPTRRPRVRREKADVGEAGAGGLRPRRPRPA